MAAILSLSLSHFRSHKMMRVEADARPVALHGPNGAGKTNILEAVSLLSPGRGLRRAAAEELIRRPENIGWRIAADVETSEGERDVITAVSSPGARRTVEIDGKSAPQSALADIAPMVWLTPAMDRLWTEGAAERRRFIDRATLSFEPGHAVRSLAYEKAMRERNRLLKDGRADPGWLSALEAQMAKAGAGLARARTEAVSRLVAAQADAETAFPRAGISLDGPSEAFFATIISDHGDPRDGEEECEAALLKTFAEGRRNDEFAGRSLNGPHRTDLTVQFTAKGVEARVCSTGEQKALLISLVLANARALAADGAAPILLLDEIAAHLDRTRRAALYDEICGIGAQVWMTAAGVEFFEELGDRGTVIAV
jgi:DNA replication and repair protein RecF